MPSTPQRNEQIEQTIVELLAKADRKAVSLAYQHYGDAVYGMILRVIQDKEIAQEVLQDVFVKVWQNAKKYDRKKGRLFTWLANIARNAAIDRTRSKDFKRDQKTDSLENFVTNNVSGGEMYLQDSGLKKVIDSLDEKYRTLIDLAYFQGYSQRELEKKLDIPLGTIKSRLRQAINQLRDILEKGDVHKGSIILLISMLEQYLS
jgi:RNA polymerase sigma factor (sigma-70 family)